jgi:hypothetical protein
MTFHDDLQFATVYERRVLDIVEHTRAEFAPKGCKEYDLRTQLNDDPEVSFEVKADRYAARTGMFVIEYMCRGRPSGISTSTADFWVYFIDGTNKYMMIPTERLRADIAAKKYYRQLTGGDGGASHMYLLNMDDYTDCLDTY